MWRLSKHNDTTREYTNATTGSKCTTTKVYTDREGNDWYCFDNLMNIPYTRSFAATMVTSLFALGLSKDDLSSHVDGLKSILRSTDADKYEKAYALVLDFESKASNATDAIKQMSGLTCVYFMLADENIDSFGNADQIRKMAIIAADTEMHNFFLTKQIDLIERFTRDCGLLTAIASPTSNGHQVPSPPQSNAQPTPNDK